jgi:predicted esterase
MPLLVLLHGQGDTGRNFLNVWLARGYPSDLLLAAPDDNTDANALDVEQDLRGLFDVDGGREYLFGFSQGGAYAAFVLFDASAASRFAAVGLASAGLAENPSSIPTATANSPAVAVVIDPTDPNNTWNQGLHVMEDFVPFLASRGYDAKLTLHHQGHTISAPEVASTIGWMLSKSK